MSLATSSERRLRLSVIILPEKLNIRSDTTDIAGITRYFHASFAMVGKVVWPSRVCATLIKKLFVLLSLAKAASSFHSGRMGFDDGWGVIPPASLFIILDGCAFR